METSKTNVKEHDLFTYLCIFFKPNIWNFSYTIISILDILIFKKFKYENNQLPIEMS